jgi:hypothetical protein
VDYLKGEQTKDNLIKWGGTLLTGGLTIGAIVATMASGGAALPFALGLGGALTGLGTAAYEYRELATVDLAAQAQQGGTKLTSQDKDTARFNLMMGRVNLLMAGLDVGLSVKAMTGLMKLGVKEIGQFGQALKFQRAGQAENALATLRELRNEVDPQTYAQIEKMLELKSAKGLGGIEAPRTPGLGKVSTMDELLKIKGIPGRAGVILDQKDVNFSDMWKLSNQNGLEYVLTKENGNFVLRSGAPDQVKFPAGVHPIAHTHLPDILGQLEPHPSFTDIDTLNTLWRENPNSPRPESVIIWGPESDNITPFGATGIDRLPKPNPNKR